MPLIPNAEIVSCVYWIRKPEHTNILRDGYVGVSKRFQRRIMEHEKITQNKHLKNAVNKYGWDNLIKEKILIGKEDYCLEIESKLRPTDNIGWNLIKGGNKPPITRWNLGTKGLVVAWNKGKPQPEETKKKVSVGVAKLWQNPEYRKHMSDVHKGKSSGKFGKKLSAETIEKIRLAKVGKPSKKKGKPISEETRLKLTQTMQSQLWTCPNCNTSGYSKGAGNRWHFDNCKGAAQCQ
jgi:group I intron endonuclease